jgi:hypothetical protein
MIFENIMNSIFNLFSTLISGINIPPLPDDVDVFMSDCLEYMQNGIYILNNYMNLEYILVLFGIILVIDIAIHVYHFVMWILKKIPMLGIS